MGWHVAEASYVNGHYSIVLFECFYEGMVILDGTGLPSCCRGGRVAYLSPPQAAVFRFVRFGVAPFGAAVLALVRCVVAHYCARAARTSAR